MKPVAVFLAAIGVALAQGYFPGHELATDGHNLPLTRFVRQAGYGPPRPSYGQPSVTSRPDPPPRPSYGQSSVTSRPDLPSRPSYGQSPPDYYGYPGHYGQNTNIQPVYGTGYPGYSVNQGYNNPSRPGGNSYGGASISQPIPHPVTNLPRDSPYGGNSGGYSAATPQISFQPDPVGYGGSPAKQQIGGNKSPDVDSYSAPPQIQPGYGVPEEIVPTGPVGYGR